MGEIIQLHVGQGGIQIANACWELYCLEHGIDTNGYLVDNCCPPTEAFNTFFNAGHSGKIIPRLIMVDSEPTVIDEVRTGPYRELFHPSTLINGKEDSGNNFSRAYNLIFNTMKDQVMDAIRNVAEECSNLHGFIMFRSLGGGTGSGMGTRILEKLVADYGKVNRLEAIIFPSPTLSPVIVEPYNSVLATHGSLEYVDCAFTMDNEALYGICSNGLRVEYPNYTNLNRIIGQIISAITTSLRFEGAINIKLQDFHTNLVPYPRVHFPMVSYAPFVPICNVKYETMSVHALTQACFSNHSQTLKCNPQDGKYTSCVLLYRGDVTPIDVNTSIQNIKAKLTNFVPWSPTGMKIGINHMPPTTVPWGDMAPASRACCMCANNSCIRKSWCTVLKKFNLMLERKAFAYHYVSEGLEESTLDEAKEDMCTLVEEYRDLEQ